MGDTNENHFDAIKPRGTSVRNIPPTVERPMTRGGTLTPVVEETHSVRRAGNGASEGRPCCGNALEWVQDPYTDSMCSDFSLHAMPRAFEVESSSWRRSLWFILFLVGAAMTITTLIATIRDYMEFESTTSVFAERPGEDGLLFPAVTLWNQNPIRKSAVNDTEFYGDVCGGAIGGLNDGGVYSEKTLPQKWNDNWYFRAAHRLEDMLLECTWRGLPCSVSDFTPVLTPAPNTRWGVGYTFNEFSNVTTKQAGRPGGLHLVLDLHTEEYCDEIWDVGVRLQFHDHQNLPERVARTHINPLLGDTVSPGSRWSFSLGRTEFISLGQPFSAPCIDLREGDQYPDPDEARNCAIGCPGVQGGDLTEVALLTTTDSCVIKCFEPRNFRFCDSVTFPYSLGNGKLRAPNFKEVNKEIIADLKKGPIARFVPDNAEDMTAAELRETIQRGLEHNVIALDIFYKEILTIMNVEVEQFTFWSMVAELGGLTGLFLGASFITLFEFVEIISMLMCNCADKRTLSKEKRRNSSVMSRSVASSIHSQDHLEDVLRLPTSRSLYKKYTKRRSESSRTTPGEVNLQSLTSV
ncbi:hypothetical protein BSKO_11895 [Bryopsis sp. KO-2023]|nr:hypothetical protein BSKO_11895 [Bryopsis sp. KO-2023]